MLDAVVSVAVAVAVRQGDGRSIDRRLFFFDDLMRREEQQESIDDEDSLMMDLFSKRRLEETNKSQISIERTMSSLQVS